VQIAALLIIAMVAARHRRRHILHPVCDLTIAADNALRTD
jgi:1,4-dihydroxy-2-naphthoyl-CoA synthase